MHEPKNSVGLPSAMPMCSKPLLSGPLLWLLLLVLMLLLPACANRLPDSPAPSVKPPAIPALPTEARQPPTQELPSICLQGCSQGLTNWRAAWQKRLTEAGLPDAPASAPTTR